MNFKMILRIQSQALLTLSVISLFPIAYALIEFHEIKSVVTFAAIGLFSIVTGIIFQKFGVGRFQRAPIAESATAILIIPIRAPTWKAICRSHRSPCATSTKCAMPR